MSQVYASKILDQNGRPFAFTRADVARRFQAAVGNVRREVRREMQAAYDAAQLGSEALRNHWANADALSPNSANSYTVRRRLRQRARYEVIENNAYLHGMLLSLANDFVGSGPKLQIVDKEMSKRDRRFVERAHEEWRMHVCYREILWRLRVAKIVDGEGLKYDVTDNREPMPVRLNYRVFEPEQLTTEHVRFTPGRPLRFDRFTRIDGLRLDINDFPVSYHVLEQHPGDKPVWTMAGDWLPARFVTHWFRRTRAWHRGIPEVTPSLPLCALLRRYTLAVIKAAETAADFAAVLKTEAPPNITAWTDADGNPIEDDPFDTFPIDQGMFTTLPWGYDMQQLKAEQPTAVYDAFVACLLREIARPLLVPFNFAAGSSADSNMASAIVDSHIYKEGHHAERLHCREAVLDKDFRQWWMEAKVTVPDIRRMPLAAAPFTPKHVWRWDRVGLDHTDPVKVATATKVLHEAGFITDRDVQETRFNRDLEDWQEDLREQIAFRNEVGPPVPGGSPSTPDPDDEEEDEETEDEDQ